MTKKQEFDPNEYTDDPDHIQIRSRRRSDERNPHRGLAVARHAAKETQRSRKARHNIGQKGGIQRRRNRRYLDKPAPVISHD